MRRTEILEGVRMMHDAVSRDVFGRCERRELSKLEAAELLGMSERQFRRWCRRLEAEGEAGLRDRRIRLPPYPQAQPPPKRSSNVLPKPDNLTCYLQSCRRAESYARACCGGSTRLGGGCQAPSWSLERPSAAI